MTLHIVIFGLSITSSWGNGHATTYRALARALAQRGHRVTFLERATPWYRAHRDLKQASYCHIETYEQLTEVAQRFATLVAQADLVILGSYVPDGIALGEWITAKATGVTAFYDIDTPVTLANLAQGGEKFVLAGAQYPKEIAWPANIARVDHVRPAEHSAFYCAQRFTLNATRADMARLGYSPSVRLFEAAACGVPVISDDWAGIETLFEPGEEILVAQNAQDVIEFLGLPERRRDEIGAAARRRFLRDHTPEQRAKDLEAYYREAATASSGIAAAVVA